MSIELRRDVRKKTFLKGRIIFNHGKSTMDCLIRDMSECGARLELSETSTLPEVFDLYIISKEQTLRSTLSWRRLSEVGVNFNESARHIVSAPITGTDMSVNVLVRRIAELEAENAALRSYLQKVGQSTAA